MLQINIIRLEDIKIILKKCNHFLKLSCFSVFQIGDTIVKEQGNISKMMVINVCFTSVAFKIDLVVYNQNKNLKPIINRCQNNSDLNELEVYLLGERSPEVGSPGPQTSMPILPASCCLGMRPSHLQ